MHATRGGTIDPIDPMFRVQQNRCLLGFMISPQREKRKKTAMEERVRWQTRLYPWIKRTLSIAHSDIPRGMFESMDGEDGPHFRLDKIPLTHA